MRIVTATEASRSFAALLDDVEHGEHIVITRSGRRVAEIGPAPVANGRMLVDLIHSRSVDVEFERDVSSVRDIVTLEFPSWPDD